ncbi:uridine kinase [Bacteroidia bacterium]|nr:uridine kinase [Bacteroidia bacterium]
MIDIICKNTQSKYTVPDSSSLAQIKDLLQLTSETPFVAAIVNNRLYDLSYQVFNPKTIEFITISHPMASRLYLQSAILALQKAVQDLFPEAILQVEHSLPGGLYCELKNLQYEINDDMVETIEARIKEIFAANLVFRREIIPTEDAIALFQRKKRQDKVDMLKIQQKLYTSLCYLEDTVDYTNACLVPSTGVLPQLELDFFGGKGFLVKTPKLKSQYSGFEQFSEHSKLFKVFQEYKHWLEVLHLDYISDLNRHVADGTVGDIIKISEAFQEKKIASIADMIDKRSAVRMIFISGPSSSGKTTFSKRLGVQLQVLGYHPIVVAMDDYFVDRDKTPRLPNGEYDFETIKALDVELFNQQMNQLLDGQEVELPSFNFETGKREYKGHKLRMDERSVLVVEGIHGLNPAMSAAIEEAKKFTIYVSALTPISIDAQTPIMSTDNRLLRRLVRDRRMRGVSPVNTFNRWQSVKQGEEQNIFPYQENADVFFNSALIYEISALKPFVEPLLNAIPETEPAFTEARMVLDFLSYFSPIPEHEIPVTSILREFLGGSSFIY